MFFQTTTQGLVCINKNTRSLTTVQNNTILKLLIDNFAILCRLTTVQDNTILKHVSRCVSDSSGLSTVQNNTILKPIANA